MNQIAFKNLLTIFSSKNAKSANTKYRIVSVDSQFQQTGMVNVKIQEVGSSHMFIRPVNSLYTNDAINYFSKEDVAHLAALYAAEQTQNISLINHFPLRNSHTKASIVIVGILFSAFLILSNLSAFKLVQYGKIAFPAGLVFFPLTYIFDDILTEVYGFKVSRRVIWTALAANIIVTLGTLLTTYLPASPYWDHQQAYSLIYHAAPRIFIASTFGYMLGEFSNSIILAKMKVLTAGNHLWLRAITSTIVGVGIDTTVFTHIAFLSTVPYTYIWKIILTMYLLKVVYEVCAMPITYIVSNYLKAKDNVDHYDFQTIFNPFSLAVDD